MKHLLYAGLACAMLASPALAGAAVPGEPTTGLPFALMAIGCVSILGAFFYAVTRLIPRSVPALVAVAVLILVPALAFAQTATPSSSVLTYQWGDAANGLFKVAIEAILPIMGVAITAAAARLPWWVSMFLTTQRIDRALQTGADYALNAVKGATAGKVLSVDVGYTVIKVALERILGSTPSWLVKEMGGAKGISERLFRVFKFDETVSDENTLSRVIKDLPTFPFAAGK